jgi:hypothetical protein
VIAVLAKARLKIQAELTAANRALAANNDQKKIKTSQVDMKQPDIDTSGIQNQADYH